MSQPGGDFIWYELMTTNPKGAKAFYDTVIGWNMDEEGDAMPNGAEYREIRRPDGGHAGGVLTLTQQMCDAGMTPNWIGYIHAPDIEGSVADLQAKGGQVHMPITEMPGVGKMAMVTDPQGAAFYLMAPTPPADRPDAQSDVFDQSEPYRCAWNELSCKDPEAGLEFYSKLLGWESPDAMDMGPMGKYYFVQNDESQIGAIYKGTSEASANWRFYFRVPDIEIAEKAIRGNGGTVTQELHEVPNGDFIVMANDPQGARFAVVGKKTT